MYVLGDVNYLVFFLTLLLFQTSNFVRGQTVEGEAAESEAAEGEAAKSEAVKSKTVKFEDLVDRA